jgi:hypothetical protein
LYGEVAVGCKDDIVIIHDRLLKLASEPLLVPTYLSDSVARG